MTAYFRIFEKRTSLERLSILPEKWAKIVTLRYQPDLARGNRSCNYLGVLKARR